MLRDMASMIFTSMLILLISATSGIAQVEQVDEDAFIIKAKDGTRKQLMIGKVTFGPTAEEIGEYRVEAAMNLAALFSGYYFLIPNMRRDSVGLIYQEIGETARIMDVAKQLDSDYLVFPTVNRIENMIRVDLTAVDVENQSERLTGHGYALIHFRNTDDDTPVFDPTITEAVQRAMAVMHGDSNMYSDAPRPHNVKPAPTMIVGGLFFNNNKALEEWDLYEEKEITSYEVAETLFDFSRRFGNYVTYDIATRDSIYAKFGLYGIENYMPPSAMEIQACNRLGVHYFLTGELKRVKDGAEIKLDLCKINGSKLEVIKTEEDSISDDSMNELALKLKIMTSKLVAPD